MSQMGWKKAAALFERVADLDTEQGTAILERECAGDDRLHRHAGAISNGARYENATTTHPCSSIDTVFDFK